MTKSPKYKCTNCNKLYRYLASFRSHLTSKHNIEFSKTDENINIAIINSMNNINESQELVETNEISYDELCIICMIRSKTTAFFRCGHKVCCHDCAKKMLKKHKDLRKCPICRKNISGVLRIYD